LGSWNKRATKKGGGGGYFKSFQAVTRVAKEKKGELAGRESPRTPSMEIEDQEEESDVRGGERRRNVREETKNSL